MSLKRYLHGLEVLRLPLDESAAEATLAAWRETLGRRETRRMSDLGLFLTAVLRDESFADDPALVYATTHTETRALEKFVDSFPFASPLLFQMSIHPGGAEQALISRQQPLTEFYPIGGIDHLLSHALMLAFTTSRPRCILLGGEERGTWLRERREASDHTFAWKGVLTDEAEGALAVVSWDPEATDRQRRLEHFEFFELLTRRKDFTWGEAGMGAFTWGWK